MLLRRFIFVGMSSLMGLPCVIFSQTVLLLQRDHEKFYSMRDHIIEELENKYEIKDYVLRRDSSFEEFRRKVKTVKPDVMVLLDNQSVTYANSYNKLASNGSINGVATMALNLHKVLKGNEDICGVAFEVPALTLVTEFKQLTGIQIRTVLTLYRKSEYQQLVEDAGRHLRMIGMNLLAVNVEEKGADSSTVEKFLTKNLESLVSKADVVWVIADNVLLSPKWFAEIWLPIARKVTTPFICGIETLAHPKFDFCAFGASPNFGSIASLVADSIYSIIEGETDPKDLGVAYTAEMDISVNMEKFRKLKLSLVEENVQQANVKLLEAK